MDIQMNAIMIAPCGMNCSLCIGHQREQRQCPGCRGESKYKRKSCTDCTIVRCDKRAGKSADFCYVCDSFPCTRLKNLDKRYRTKYNMSMIENLEHIRQHGIDAFVQSQGKRYHCDSCGGVLCVHRDYCVSCGQK